MASPVSCGLMGLPLKSAVTANPETISLSPDSFAEDCWILAFETDEQERVEVSLSPEALQEFHLQARSIPASDRRAEATAQCDVCGDDVDLFLAIPNTLGRPVHRQCYSDAFGVDWVSEYR